MKTNWMILLLVTITGLGLARDQNPSGLQRQPSTTEFVLFEGNNIRNWIGNQGHLVSHIPTGNAGCEWPTGSGNTAIFASGVWVIGQVDGELRSAVAEFTSEWSPGTIPYDTETKLPLSDVPSNSSDHQIYLIQEGDSSDPVSEYYNREYATWPASDGAPAHDGEYFTDLNGNDHWDSGEVYEDFDLDGLYDPPNGAYITGEDPPEYSGVIQAWYVMNDWDASRHSHLWNTPPLGIEAQVLIYTRDDDPIYENVQFHVVTLVNKGGATIDSAYYGHWSDVDLGDASDDQGGCDSTLSLGYIYNGTPYDQRYGIVPPAVGYDFLQGPMVDSPGDTVWHNGSTYLNQRTIELTAHILILKSSLDYGDPEDVIPAYYFMQGLQDDGDVIIDPWGHITTFHVAGDPVSGSGWTASINYYPSDKRNLMSTGPFDMPPWDDLNNNGKADFGEPGVQVLHSAQIIVSGANNLDAITSLKYASRFTQYGFDHKYEEYALAAPILSTSSNDLEIILNWYDGAEEYESLQTSDYEFEGYNLYQGATDQGPWTRLNTFDKENGIGIILDQQFDDNGLLLTGPVQFGSDTGLEHLVSIQTDALNGDVPLVNNKSYHFALSAYIYGPEAIPKTLESEKTTVSIRPHLKWDSATTRDTLSVSGPEFGEVSVIVDVRDPDQLTGLDYEIGFDYDSTRAEGRWHLIRAVNSDQDTVRVGDWFSESSQQVDPFYIDGFDLRIADVSFEKVRFNSSWQQTVNTEGTRTETLELLAVSPGGVDSLAWDTMDQSSLVHLDTLYGRGYYWDYFEIEERDSETWFILYKWVSHDVRIQSFASNFGAVDGDRIADIQGIGGGSNNLEFLQADLEIRFTEQGQNVSIYKLANQLAPTASLVKVPFEIWDVEHDIQLCVGIYDRNISGGIQDTSLDNWENTLDLDWVIVFDRDYKIHGATLDSLRNNPYSGWCWQFNDQSLFSIGDVVHLSFLNPVVAGEDVYQWTTDIAGEAYSEAALEQIQVFPNPFFGYHAEQTSSADPYVTFSNLPNGECTLRIFSLAGQLVRRFDHQSGTYETWDLTNTYGSAMASGIYIVHVEVPGVGNKILKLAVFQPER